MNRTFNEKAFLTVGHWADVGMISHNFFIVILEVKGGQVALNLII